MRAAPGRSERPVGEQGDQSGSVLLLFRQLQETQMSTTSKLEEAEHKLQTLQTGWAPPLPSQWVQGRLKRVGAPPAPTCRCHGACRAWEPTAGAPAARADAISHP